MGFFSFKTADTGESIANEFSERHVFPVYMFRVGQEPLEEKSYEGYGSFGGVCAYVQWMKNNIALGHIEGKPYEGMSDDGLRDAFFKDKFLKCAENAPTNGYFPVVLTTTQVTQEEIESRGLSSPSCKFQGFFY